MSASLGSEGGQDFDLNLAPIIDCFTVLITYLLVSASFLSIAVLDVGVAASGGAAPAIATIPPVSLEIQLHSDHGMTFNISGGPRGLALHVPIAASRSVDWDLPNMKAKISALQKQYPSMKDVTVTAESSVRYRELVKIIENVKTIVGKVYLAG